MLGSRDLPPLAAVLTASYFVFMIAAGLNAQFAPDDMQNLYRYWNGGWFALLKGNLLVATDYYRPLGGLFYLPLFRMFGFDPRPYRVVCFVLLCVGAWLLYALARRLTGSRFGGAVAVVAGGFHSSAAGAYFSTAVVYEVLCFVFTVGSLLYYIRIRQAGRVLSWRQAGVLLALAACALNAKEMGVVAAAGLVLYEAVVRRARPRPRAAEVRPVLAVCALTAAYVWAKTAGGAMLPNVPSYRPEFTLDRYLETSRAFVGYLLLTDGPAETWVVAVFWGALISSAVALRRPDMLFGALFAFVAFLPVNFISVREGFVLHIPLIGLGVWCGGLVVSLLDAAGAHFHAGCGVMAQIRALVFAGLLVAAIAIHYPHFRYVEGLLANAQRENTEVLAEFRRLDLKFRPGERVLFRNTPFEDNFDVYFIAKLWAGDPSVRVSVTTEFDKRIRGDDPGASQFDRVFRFDGTKMTDGR